MGLCTVQSYAAYIIILILKIAMEVHLKLQSHSDFWHDRVNSEMGKECIELSI